MGNVDVEGLNNIKRISRMYTYSSKKWTSDLVISANCELTEYIPNINNIINYLQINVSSIHNDPTDFKFSEDDVLPIHNQDILDEYGIMINGVYDNTCMMKGLAIDNIRRLLDYHEVDSYIISFGGDIYGHNCPKTVIPIEGTDFRISIEGDFSVFTSGNVLKRGNHVIGGDSQKIVTVVYKWSNVVDYGVNTYMDALATKTLAKEFKVADSIATTLKNEYPVEYRYTLEFNKGILANRTYCASPFFNEEQIQIRDHMVSRFSNVFRPDLQETAKQYNSDQSNRAELAKKVVHENMYGVCECEFLVFPNDTDDLGTLYEVGIQAGRASNRFIIKYNRFHNYYTVFVPTVYEMHPKRYVVNCSDKRGAILMGLLTYCRIGDDDKNYELMGNTDNIMLSVRYRHVEFNKDTNVYDIYEPKIVESSTESTKVIGQDYTLSNYRITPGDYNDYIDFDDIYDVDIDINDKVITSVS